MNTSRKHSIFSIAAHYGLIAPFVAGVIIGFGLYYAVPHVDEPVDTAFRIATCILFSSALASTLSFFGIREHGWQAIGWEAVVGLHLSCFAYAVLVFAGLLLTARQ